MQHLLQLRKKIGRLGSPLLYVALLLYYALKQSETPRWAKRVVLGALAYLITPVDAIPDLSPFIGYTDDLGLLSYALVLISANITPEIKTRARARLNSWIGDVHENQLARIDEML